MVNEDIVVIKKINRLDKIKVQPTLYNQKEYNPDEPGEVEGAYKGNTLLGSKRNVTPIYDSLKEQWAFEGTIQDLKRLQAALKFKDSSGKLIEVEEDVFTDKYHPFWAARDLWIKKIMEDGSAALVLKHPLDELLYRIQQGNSFTKKADENQSTYVISESNFEIVSPKRETKIAADKVSDQMDALRLLDKMSLDKMNAIAYLLDIPGYAEGEKDTDTLKALLYSSALTNTGPLNRYGSDVTYQSKFIELAKAKNDELNIMQKVQKAKMLGIISANGRTGYTFKGEKLDAGQIRNDRDLMRFYLGPKNYDFLLEVEQLIKDAEDINIK